MKTLGSSLRMTAVALLLLPAAASRGAAQKPASRGAGGVSLLLEVKAAGPGASDVVERTAAVIRRRCVRLGARCELAARAGGVENRLALRFSTAKDSERVKRVLLARGLEVRAVVSPPHPAPLLLYGSRAEAEAAARPGEDVLPLEGYGEPEAYVVAERDPLVTGDDVRGAEAVRARPGHFRGEYEVSCTLRAAGGRRLRVWTGANIGRYVAVVLDGRALSAPYIRAPIWLDVVVSGGFDRRRAEDWAAAISGGNLPAHVEVLEQSEHKR